MAKTYKSIRAKGRKAEKEVAKIFRETGIDKNARRQLLSGASYLKGDINTSIGYTVEVKKQEKIQIWQWIKQAEEQGIKEHQPSLLVFGRNNSPYYAILDLYEFCSLFQKANRPLDNMNKELYYKINSLIKISKEVNKLLKNETRNTTKRSY
jgi:hypothetical protein